MTAAQQQEQRRLRAGVIGLGWAGQQHVAAYAADPRVDLVALSAKEEHLLASLGEEHGVPGRYTDWQQMIAEAELDVVSIATPTFLHAPMASAALEAGLHVLCEKPMAENSAGAARMVEAATRAGRVLDVSFNHRQRGDVAALRRVVDSGVLGKLYYAKTGWLRRQGIPGLGTWFTRAQSAGGGAMMDIGVHMLDMSLHLMGEPRVTAASATTHAEFGPRGRGPPHRLPAHGRGWHLVAGIQLGPVDPLRPVLRLPLRGRGRGQHRMGRQSPGALPAHQRLDRGRGHARRAPAGRRPRRPARRGGGELRGEGPLR